MAGCEGEPQGLYSAQVNQSGKQAAGFCNMERSGGAVGCGRVEGPHMIWLVLSHLVLL